MIARTDRLESDARVVVTHDLGTEHATVLSTIGGTDHPRYIVRFDDGTISSWGAHMVRAS